MKRVMRLILGIKDIMLKCIDGASLWQQLSQIISVEMIQEGQVTIFKMVQVESFNNDVKLLISEKKMVPSNSSISQVDSYLDTDNIMQDDGRLRKCSFTGAEQHLVILPRKSEASDIIIKNCNLKTSSSSFCVCKELTTTSIGK